MKRSTGRVSTRRAQTYRLALVTLALVIPSPAQTARSAANDPVHRVVLVSIQDRKLAVIENGTVIARFSVAVGKAASPSPTGEFQIVTRVCNPSYYRPGTVIASGKDNPLGTRWVGLSQKGYGIHGTNAPRSVGHPASHGCIRLRNRDMERLFAMLRIGDSVEIRGDRDELVAQVFGNGTDGATVAGAQDLGQFGGQ
jgi:lipoprotein-anchoring transpeptidase ErfK/SrfK